MQEFSKQIKQRALEKNMVILLIVLITINGEEIQTTHSSEYKFV